MQVELTVGAQKFQLDQVGESKNYLKFSPKDNDTLAGFSVVYVKKNVKATKATKVAK
jgi:hypothetical protein